MATETHNGVGSNHVIVCGLGHVGYRSACLLRRMGRRGVVISLHASDDRRRAIEPEFAVIVGDAREDEILRQAGVEAAGAIIAATDDDLANVSIALDARRMNSRIAVVVRLFDQDLAGRLKEALQVEGALSASALAAPAFVAAALGEQAHGSFTVGAKTWVIVERRAGEAAGQGESAGRVVLARRRDEQWIGGVGEAKAGDLLTVIAPAPAPGGPGQALPRRRAAWLALSGWWRGVPRAFRLALGVLLAFVAASVAVVSLAMKLPVVDALYFVVTTITTVGYGDINLLSAPFWLKLYGVVLMLAGASIIATLIGILTDSIVSIRLGDLLARRCERFQGHVVVIGLGSVGLRLVEELLRAGQQVVAIDRRDDGPFVPAARAIVPVVIGDAKAQDTLRRAGAGGAKAVIAATDGDLANLSIALATKRLCKRCRAVVRIFDSTLAGKMQGALGVDSVQSVSAAAAPTFVASALCAGTLQALIFPDRLAAIFQRQIGDVETPTGLDESVLLLRRRDAEAFEPVGAHDRPQAGDVVIGVRWFPLAPVKEPS